MNVTIGLRCCTDVQSIGNNAIYEWSYSTLSTSADDVSICWDNDSANDCVNPKVTVYR